MDILRIMVRTLAIRVMTFALTLASLPVPNAGSYDEGEKLTGGGRVSGGTELGCYSGDGVLRARKRSSERMATALMRRTMTAGGGLAGDGKGSEGREN